MRFLCFGVSTIRGQLMIVVMLAVFSVIITGRLIESISNFDYNDIADVDLIGQRALTLAYLLDTADEDERRRIVSRSAEVGIDIEVLTREQFEKLPGPEGMRSNFGALLSFLFPTDEALPRGAKVSMIGKKPMLVLPINDMEVLLYRSFPDSILTQDFTGAMLYYTLSFLTLSLLFSIFGMRFLTAPLMAISNKISDTELFLSQNTPLPEAGSVEIAGLARALNEMRTRIHDMMRTRTAMLRSVGHDLRTPLTRVRLRAERIEDASVREQILSDIQHINAMIDITLDYLRDDRGKERPERTDLASIMQTICDDFSDVGATISYTGPGRLIWLCKPTALTRAITNLCENGIKFGGDVELILIQRPNFIRIEVRDHGPGIPEQFRQRVFEPFFQLNSARTKKDGQAGFGLGLSIVEEIVRDHGGNIEFDNNVPNGLVVRLTFSFPVTS
ncbi:signal transduction histidine kinase [Agrobacterium vitis]|nr:signal transduction histidine kinase [Agrobacterium vitis]MBE1440356.1 signal transduction histidine kinase [Agrobacterium vitis]